MTSIGPVTVDTACVILKTQSKSSTLAIALGVGVGGGFLLILVIVVVCCLRKKNAISST